ncbi:MAG: hypothetical protein JNJ54_19480, partial [Myxococcaceae bacterium]|nr:hypothetical protein [Myxococcaceae bacterium]
CSASGNLNDSVGELVFTDAVRGYTVSYTFRCSTTASGFNWSVVLAPGTWEVRLARGQYSTAANVNLVGVNYQVLTGLAVNGNVSNVVLAEQSYTVSGTVTVNGAPPTRDGVYCSASGNLNDSVGELVFTESSKGYTTGYTFRCSTTASGFTWSVVLAPGTWEVRLARGQYSTAANVNLVGVNYQVLTGLVVNGNVSNVVLAEQSYTVSGTVTVNGAPPTRDGVYCSASGNLNDSVGELVFTESSKGYTTAYTFRCSTTASGFTWSVVLAPGTWEVRLARGQYSTAANVNLVGVNYQVLTGLAVNSNASNVLLAERSTSVSGTITVNGAPPTRDGVYCSASGNLNDSVGELQFFERQRGYTTGYTFRCSTTASGFNWTVLLAPGTWEVRLARGQYSTAANVNLVGVNYLFTTSLVVP